MSLEKDIAMMALLKKIKEMNMTNVVKNQSSFDQTLNIELDQLQQKLENYIGVHYVPNFISSVLATNYVYAYLDKNQELVISSVDLHSDDSELYNNDSNFGKCKLKDNGYQKWHKKYKYIQVVRFEGIVKPTTCNYWFDNCGNLTEIKNIKNLDTSECENMDSMFNGCVSLTTLDLSNFDTSKVENMFSMFNGCISLTILNLSNFDTSNVTDMSYMFQNCTSLTTLDLSNFDTSKVENMFSMFNGCISLTILNLSNFNTSKVKNMSFMFYNCTSLTILDLNNFDTSKVTAMVSMFDKCSKLTTLDLSNFDTSKVISMNAMFNSCLNLTSLSLSNFDTSKVINMSYMFKNCANLGSITCPKSIKEEILSQGDTEISSTVTWIIV